jgi:hypothetical protein
MLLLSRNPFHTPVVPHHYTTANPLFKCRAAPKEAYIFAKIHVRERVLGSRSNLIANPRDRHCQSSCQFPAIDKFVLSARLIALFRLLWLCKSQGMSFGECGRNVSLMVSIGHGKAPS